MAGLPDGFRLPLTCAVSDDPISHVTCWRSLVRKVWELEDGDAKTTMLRQLQLLRQIVVDEAVRSECFRCVLGSVPASDRVYLWFPLALEHARGVLTVQFFDRLIDVFKTVQRSDMDGAVELASDILSAAS
jgi:hypothetical protein